MPVFSEEVVRNAARILKNSGDDAGIIDDDMMTTLYVHFEYGEIQVATNGDAYFSKRDTARELSQLTELFAPEAHSGLALAAWVITMMQNISRFERRGLRWTSHEDFPQIRLAS